MATLRVQVPSRRLRKGGRRTGQLVRRRLRPGKVRRVRRVRFKGSGFLKRVANRRPSFSRRR